MGLFGFSQNKQEFITLDELRKIFEKEWQLTPDCLCAIDLAKKLAKTTLKNGDQGIANWGNSVVLAKNDEFREFYWGKIKAVYSSLVNYENFKIDLQRKDSSFHKKYFEDLKSDCICAGGYQKNPNDGAPKTYTKVMEILATQFKRGQKETGIECFDKYYEYVINCLKQTRKNAEKAPKRYLVFAEIAVEAFKKAK